MYVRIVCMPVDDMCMHCVVNLREEHEEKDRQRKGVEGVG